MFKRTNCHRLPTPPPLNKTKTLRITEIELCEGYHKKMSEAVAPLIYISFLLFLS